MMETLTPPGFERGRTYTGRGKGGPDPCEGSYLLRRPIPPLQTITPITRYHHLISL